MTLRKDGGKGVAQMATAHKFAGSSPASLTKKKAATKGDQKPIFERHDKVMKKMFRNLLASEIDCRAAQVSAAQDGAKVSILLYKDARVDQNLLDETFGPFGWQRKHEIIDGRLYCTVSVMDKVTGQWVSKQDVGTESNTEKEKGQASDSFKRACFNWGIGRELYTAPRIVIKLSKNEVYEKNGRLNMGISLSVKEIEYKDNAISRLVIADNYGKVRYTYDTAAPAQRAKAETPKAPADPAVPAAKRPISEKQFAELCQRIENGEEVLTKARQVFTFTPEQETKVQSYL